VQKKIVFNVERELYLAFPPLTDRKCISHLKAVRYSTSPIGGSTPPVQAMLTLKPSPGPTPTYKDPMRKPVLVICYRKIHKLKGYIF